MGSVSALDANTGKQLWKTYVIEERPKPVRVNTLGVQQWAPAGGSVWNTPTVDPKRNAVYFGTGDATTYPAASTSDSVMALNMDTGKRLWSYQVVKNDSFLGGCGGADASENCPKRQGPDWDIPAPVILRTVNDRDMVIVSTKPGDIMALDPDKEGAVLWKSNVRGVWAGDGPDAPNMGEYARMSGVLWGGAASPDMAYFGLTGAGGLAAMRLQDGKLSWLSTLGSTPEKRVSYGAATTAIPGVIFVGGSDGTLKAVSSADGTPLWKFDTNQEFQALNRVPTHGGSISNPGAVVVDGRVYVGSGFAVIGGTPGNALLAFGVD